jgi:hypothetical protein
VATSAASSEAFRDSLVVLSPSTELTTATASSLSLHKSQSLMQTVGEAVVPIATAAVVSMVNLELLATIHEAYEKLFSKIHQQTASFWATQVPLATPELNGNGDTNVDLPDGESVTGDICWQKFKQRFNEIIRDVIRFAKLLPGFADLDLDDQIALLKGGGFEVGCVVHAPYINGDTNVMFLPTLSCAASHVISCNRLKAGFQPSAAFMDLLFAFCARFNAFHLTSAEVALFCALMLIMPDRVAVQNQRRVQQIQESLIQTLQAQMTAAHPTDVGLFPRLLMIISSLRELSIEYRHMFTMTKDHTDPKDNEVQYEILEILGLV